MKKFLQSLSMVCFAILLSSPILADEAATPSRPSDDTIREFHNAVGAGDQRLVEKMLGSFPDMVSTPLPDDDAAKRVLPIFTAIDHQQTAVLSLLLKHGGSYVGQANGQTPLDRATIFGGVEVVRVLLDAGADVNGLSDPANTGDLDDPSHGTPLRDAVSCGKMDIARLLVQRGANVDVFSAAGMGWTDWVTAKIKQHPELTDYTDGWRYTPLCYAVAGGAASTAEVLLANGADVSHTYDDGGTLLHLATYYGYHDVISVLLAHGADINARNKAGETAVDYAVKYKQQDAGQLLRAHGGKRASEL